MTASTAEIILITVFCTIILYRFVEWLIDLIDSLPAMLTSPMRCDHCYSEIPSDEITLVPRLRHDVTLAKAGHPAVLCLHCMKATDNTPLHLIQ